MKRTEENMASALECKEHQVEYWKKYKQKDHLTQCYTCNKCETDREHKNKKTKNQLMGEDPGNRNNHDIFL